MGRGPNKPDSGTKGDGIRHPGSCERTSQEPLVSWPSGSKRLAIIAIHHGTFDASGKSDRTRLRLHFCR